MSVATMTADPTWAEWINWTKLQGTVLPSSHLPRLTEKEVQHAEAEKSAHQVAALLA